MEDMPQEQTVATAVNLTPAQITQNMHDRLESFQQRLNFIVTVTKHYDEGVEDGLMTWEEYSDLVGQLTRMMWTATRSWEDDLIRTQNELTDLYVMEQPR